MPLPKPQKRKTLSVSEELAEAKRVAEVRQAQIAQMLKDALDG